MKMDFGKSIGSVVANTRNLWHRAVLRLRCAAPNAQYRSYLDVQLTRSLSKKEGKNEQNAAILIEALVKYARPPLESAVLCIGCRNSSEIECLRKRGFTQVKGIDLFSESPDIIVMDMHKMRFEDNQFDVIYSSHSIEHAYDAKKAATEMVRVARDGAFFVIEVPVGFNVRGADRIDFKDIEGLLAVFEGYTGKVLWSKEEPPMSPTNSAGTSVLRAVFSISKRL